MATTTEARPNPLQYLGALRPRRLAMAVQNQGKQLQRVVWRVEDFARFGAKFALKAAIKAARPALICECACAHGHELLVLFDMRSQDQSCSAATDVCTSYVCHHRPDCGTHNAYH